MFDLTQLVEVENREYDPKEKITVWYGSGLGNPGAAINAATDMSLHYAHGRAITGRELNSLLERMRGRDKAGTLGERHLNRLPLPGIAYIGLPEKVYTLAGSKGWLVLPSSEVLLEFMASENDQAMIRELLAKLANDITDIKRWGPDDSGDAWFHVSYSGYGEITPLFIHQLRDELIMYLGASGYVREQLGLKISLREDEYLDITWKLHIARS